MIAVDLSLLQSDGAITLVECPLPAAHLQSKGPSNLRRRLGRNSIWKLVGDGSRFLLALFLLLVARHYGPETFGSFSLLYAALIVLSIVADLGLNLLTTRQIASHKAQGSAFLRSFLAYKLALLPIWILLPAGIFEAAPYPGVSLKLILVLAASFAARNLLEFFCAIFSGFEKIQYEAAFKLVAHLVVLGLGYWAMSRGFSIAWMGLSMLAGYFAAAGAAAAWCHRKWHLIPLAFDSNGLSLLYSEALPLIGIGAGLATLTKWNTLLLGVWSITPEHIGWFGASEKVVGAMAALPMLVTAASYPVLADLYKNDHASFLSARSWLVKKFVFFGLLTAASIIISSSHLIRILFGASYAGAQTALCLLAAGLVFSFPNHMLLNVLIASGRSARGVWAVLAACLANIALTAFLIPMWGIAGSALASSLAQGVLFIAAYLFSTRLKA